MRRRKRSRSKEMKLFSCTVHFALDKFLGLIGGGADLVERKMLWTRIKKLSALSSLIFWTFCVTAQTFSHALCPQESGGAVGALGK
jgi:hypothetical protein